MAIAGLPVCRTTVGFHAAAAGRKNLRHDTFLDVKHAELREVLHGAWTGAGNLRS